SYLAVPGTVVGAGSGLGALAVLACRDLLPPVYLYSLAWEDDPYSKDLADRFSALFREQLEEQPWTVDDRPRAVWDPVPYGVGGFGPPDAARPPAPATGTQALPLYREVLEAVTLATCRAPETVGEAGRLHEGLRALHWEAGGVRLADEGLTFFDEDGNRSDG